MDISNLVNLISNDLERDGSYDRYPVRFLSIRYEKGISDEIIQLKNQLKNVKIIDVKDMLTYDDAWITVDSFRKKIYDLDQTKSFIVIGFSEYARFLSQSEFISLLISLLELENQSKNLKRRIYIFCFALYNQIKKNVEKYNRRKDAYNPLLNETDIEDLPHIFFLDNALNLDCNLNKIVNSKEWFSIWRNSDIDIKYPIICSSKTLFYFYTLACPDNVYNIQQIKTCKDILKYIYSIDNLHDYKECCDEFYSRTITLVNHLRNKEFTDIILSEVNVQKIDASNIYSLWKNSDTFKKWLIQNYVLIKGKKDSYLYKVMLLIEKLSNEEFYEKVYQSIFDFKDISLCKERCKILNSIKKIDRDISFSNKMILYYNEIIIEVIQKETNIILNEIDFNKDNKELFSKRDILKKAFQEKIVPYLTCYSIYERQLIIWLYRMQFIDDKQIKNIYTDLWQYLNCVESGNEHKYACRFDEYFRKYRKIKLEQKETFEYEYNLEEWNKDENTFYKWYLDNQIPYPEVYLKSKKFVENVYVLDGVGAEFMEYIVKLLDNKGYCVESVNYGKCHLPSITSVAKKFYPEIYEWIYEYDNNVIHGGTYRSVHNIEKALSTIELLIDKIISFQEECKFAIIADHGSTVGHKLQKKEKKYNFDKSEHDGRCYLNKEKKYVHPSNDYILYDDEFGKQWVIALNQQSLYNNSKYEVHGGATPEEILVPIIIAYKGKETNKDYDIKAENLKVSGLQKKIEIKINPTPKNTKVFLKAKDGTDTEMEYNNNTNTWIGILNRGIEQDIEIIIGNQTRNFRTIPSTKMGDDLFDD